MAYRFRDPSPVFENLLGLRNAPGGQWFFYELGTTDPKDTYQNYDLSGTPNTNPITLTSAGRFPVPVWLDGNYTVELKAADGSSIINPTDIRPEIAPGLAIPDPTGHSGEYLTNDGSTVQWSGVIWNLPDPTGSAGYMLVVSSDGTDYILQPQPTPPEIPDPEIVINDTAPYSFRAGVSDDTTKYIAMYGTGQAPANLSGRTTSVTIPLPTSLVKCFGVFITPNTGAVGAFGVGATYSVVGYELGEACASFSVEFINADDGGDSGYQITVPIDFTWKAEGTVTVT